MESIEELRRICQYPRRDADNWHMRHISRRPSIYITWALLHTSISANGATLLFLLTGMVASAAFIFGTKLSFLIGGILLQVWYIMDMVDGEIARYKKQTSLTGVYFDRISHYIINPIFFFCIGLGLYFMEGRNVSIFLMSLLSAYSNTMINASTDVRRSALYGSIQNSSSEPEDVDIKDMPVKQRSIFARAFSLLHMLCVMPAIMDILLLSTVFDFLTGLNSTSWFIKFYAVGATIVWSARVGFFVIKKKLD